MIFTITVTWLDDRTETWHADGYKILDGQLVLSFADPPARRRDAFGIPLSNVRHWEAKRA